MSSVNTNKSGSPIDALKNLMGSVVGEAGRAVSEFGQHTAEDIASIGKGIETGGFLGGIVQAFDVFSVGNIVSNVADAATGPGQLPPPIKELISGAVNVASGNPIWIKDLFDMATSPAQPGVPPSAPNQVPPPDVEQLRGNAPRAPGDTDRSGYTESPAPPRSRGEVCVCTEQAAMPLQEMLAAMEFLRDSPECAARFPGIHAALNDDSMSIAEQNTLIIATVLREHPEILDALGDVDGAEEARAAIPRGEVPTTPASPPTASTGEGDMSQAGPQLQGLLGGALGFLGNLLSNPMVQGLLAPVLTGVLAAVPPLQVLIPFLPVILPMAGQLMSGLGGALSGGGDAGAGAAPGGLGGDAFGGMLNSLIGGFTGGVGLPAGALPLVA